MRTLTTGNHRTAWRALFFWACLTLITCPSRGHAATVAELGDWPAPVNENRPWTRWWWLGSAVDETNLTRQLTQFREAGLGGVEICPIYGAKGYEDRFLNFLSAPWLARLAHTTTEARRLGLGVDLTTGTGWPFGGPHVSAEDASAKAVLQRFDPGPDERFTGRLPPGRLQCLIAVNSGGGQLDLTGQVTDGRLDWTAPTVGDWHLYAILANGPAQKVKRPAPGGAGSVLDPYSVTALDHYLADFDRAFTGFPAPLPRAHFHDSFEYYGAEWTPALFREFAARRGYDLRTQLPAWFGTGAPDTVARVKYDFRTTLGELHQDYVRHWTDWAHRLGGRTRNQAHGAPGNLLDLYGTVDIPETEIFGSIEEANLPMNKLASSAAHVAGHNLASAEAFTWLTEHFHASLAQVKTAADYLFLAGVNHLFFHGIPYSPAAAPWPGWQFYAAVNFGPQGGLWHDLPEFNAYVTRCQSVLQGGRPDADYLVYFPLADVFQTPDGLLIPLTVHNAQTVLAPQPFYQLARQLWTNGVTYDFVSDQGLSGVTTRNGRLQTGGNDFAGILVPPCRLMPETTLQKLVELGGRGAPVIFLGEPPLDVPGWGNLAARRAVFQAARAALATGAGGQAVATNRAGLPESVRAAREHFMDYGIRFTRRVRPDGWDYFLANQSGQTVSDWITLAHPAALAWLLDPRFAHRVGRAARRLTAEGRTQLFLQLEPGESLILRTLTTGTAEGPTPPWPYTSAAGSTTPLTGTWRVEFLEGGPELPPTYTTAELASWTTQPAESYRRFSGTARYTLEFDHADTVGADLWRLNFGDVGASARVALNGQPVGNLWSAPFALDLGPALRHGRNSLVIEVTNLAANRVRDLDLRQVDWKYFYDANLAVKNGRGVLDATRWSVLDSGLLRPVTLQPRRQLHP